MIVAFRSGEYPLRGAKGTEPRASHIPFKPADASRTSSDFTLSLESTR
jgi:hypothetical protein